MCGLQGELSDVVGRQWESDKDNIEHYWLLLNGLNEHIVLYPELLLCLMTHDCIHDCNQDQIYDQTWIPA